MARTNNRVMNGTDQPFVSVIIPVYCNWDALSACLDCLAKQTYPRSRFEVLIINNDPGSKPPYRIESVNIVWCEESKVGSYAARNKGLAESTGEIVGFTDSDCLPREDWIERAVHWFRVNPSLSRLAGRVEIVTRSPPLRKMSEIYEMLFEFPQEVFVHRQGACATANMFARRLVFDHIGKFDDRYLSGGDIEWGARARRAGFDIVYAKNVVISHPARRSYRALLQKARRVGAGKRVHDRAEFFRAHISMLKAFVPPVRMFVRASRVEVRTGAKIAAMMIHYQLKIVKAFSRLCVAYGARANRV